MAGNPLQTAIRMSLETLPSEILQSINLTVELLLSTTPKTYSIYEPLLLLPAHAHASKEWISFFSQLDTTHKTAFFSRLASAVKVTHIAINAPIQPTITAGSHDQRTDNVQRRPNITPLHGDFGVFVPSPPTTQDFENAFWVSARQNGITQTWAPLYTMFSRGNVTEKARLLTLPSIKSATQVSGSCTAIDMYAGIGYFAFSYCKAGCAKVLGFELNPWSVEGLRRGARANKWPCTVVKPEGMPKDSSVAFVDRLTVFEMSNEVASNIVERNRQTLPPVRHVNLGLLPTSSGAYGVAVRCLDPGLGGWLHVHENFATKEVMEKAEEVKVTIQDLVREIKGTTWEVQLEHIEKVKTYAPGVMHCVLDIFLQARVLS